MRRSYLEKKYFKKIDQSLRTYKKQGNYCSRKNYFLIREIMELILNWLKKKKFWKNDSEIVGKLNEFFKNAVSALGITENSFIINAEYKDISDPV